METIMVRHLQEQHLPHSSTSMNQNSLSFGDSGEDDDSYYNDRRMRGHKQSFVRSHSHDKIKHAASVSGSAFVGRNSKVDSSSSSEAEVSLSDEEASSFSSVPFVPVNNTTVVRSSQSSASSSSSSSSRHDSTSGTSTGNHDDGMSSNSSSCTTTQSTSTDHHHYHSTSTDNKTDNNTILTTEVTNKVMPNRRQHHDVLPQRQDSSRKSRPTTPGGSLSLRSVFGNSSKTNSSSRRNRGSTGRLYTSERRLKSRRAIHGMRNSTSVASLEFDNVDDEDDLMSEVMMKVQTAKEAAGASGSVTSSPFIADDDDRSGTLSFGYHNHDNTDLSCYTTNTNNHIDNDSDSDSHLFQYHDTAPSLSPPPNDFKKSFTCRSPTTPSNMIIDEQVSPLVPTTSRRMYSMGSTTTSTSSRSTSHMSYSPSRSRPSPVLLRFMDSTKRNNNDIINTNTSRSLSNMITQMEQEQLQQWGHQEIKHDGDTTKEHNAGTSIKTDNGVGDNDDDDELFPEFELSSSNIRGGGPGSPFTPTTTTTTKRMEKRKSLSESCIISSPFKEVVGTVTNNNAVKNNNNADHDEEEPVAASTLGPSTTTTVLTIREVHRNTTILKISSSSRHVTANTSMHDNNDDEDDLLVDWPSALPTTKLRTPRSNAIRRSDRWSEIHLSTSAIPRHLLTKNSSSLDEEDDSQNDDASMSANTSTRSLFAGFLLWGGGSDRTTNNKSQDHINNDDNMNLKRQERMIGGDGHSSGYGTGNTAEEEAIRERAMTILRRCSSSMNIDNDGEDNSAADRSLSYFDGEGSGSSSRQMMVVFNESTKHHLSPTRSNIRRSSSRHLIESSPRRSMTGPSLPPSGTTIHHTTTNSTTTQQNTTWTFIFFPLSLFKFNWNTNENGTLVVPNHGNHSHEGANYSIVKRTSGSSTTHSQEDNTDKKKLTVNSLATSGMTTANQCAFTIGHHVDQTLENFLNRHKTKKSRRGWKQRASMEASLLVESYRDFALFCASVVAPNYVERPEI